MLMSLALRNKVTRRRGRIMENKEPHNLSSTNSNTLTPLQVKILAFVMVGAKDEEIAESDARMINLDRRLKTELDKNEEKKS